MAEVIMDLAGQSILVTGGAGFIGSHLVERLIAEQPRNLIVVDNLFLGKEQNLAEAMRRFPDLRFYQEDTCDFGKMQSICSSEEIEIVFDLATIPLPASLEKPYWSSDQILRMAMNWCELCREGAFRTLIHCSTSEVYGTASYVPMDENHPLAARTPYAAAKAGGDLLLSSYQRSFDIDALIVRPFNTYGPRQNDQNYAGIIPLTMRRILSGKAPVIYGDGRQTRDFTFVTDTVAGIVQASKHVGSRGRAVNVASQNEISILELVQTIVDAMAYDGEIVFADPRPGDVRRHLADVSWARDQCGFSCDVSLAEGIRRTVSWYRETEPAL